MLHAETKRQYRRTRAKEIAAYTLLKVDHQTAALHHILRSLFSFAKDRTHKVDKLEGNARRKSNCVSIAVSRMYWQYVQQLVVTTRTLTIPWYLANLSVQTSARYQTHQDTCSIAYIRCGRGSNSIWLVGSGMQWKVPAARSSLGLAPPN